jgi:aminomethyltransferase
MARRTPLFDEHVALGARIVEFGGWDMPLVYGNAFDEHRAVRTACGLFDVSHMGEITLCGAEAAAVVGRLATNDVSRLADGRAQYTLMCNERGGIIDDLIVYRLRAGEYLLVVNAARAAVDAAWVRGHTEGGVTMRDASDEWALLALQGPRAADALGPLVSRPLADLPPFAIREERVASVPVWVSRTGYTGEDGFEILVPAGDAVRVWRELVGSLHAVGGVPVGLAARDTLRLEAGLLLYGTDMDEGTTPWEAGLGWVARGHGFIGEAALAAAREPGRRLVGLVMDDPGVPRHGHPVWRGGERVGEVTSGTKSPTLDSFVALAYVSGEPVAPGTPLAVEMRGRHLRAHVVGRPFYRRSSRGVA